MGTSNMPKMLKGFIVSQHHLELRLIESINKKKAKLQGVAPLSLPFSGIRALKH